MKSKIDQKTPFWVKTSNHLEEIVKENINSKGVSYYFFYAEWDLASSYFVKKLQENECNGSQNLVYCIDIFDIPNGLGILKSAIKDYRETMSTNQIQNYTKIPMLVRMHGGYPVVVDYNGAIGAELGV